MNNSDVKPEITIGYLIILNPKVYCFTVTQLQPKIPQQPDAKTISNFAHQQFGTNENQTTSITVTKSAQLQPPEADQRKHPSSLRTRRPTFSPGVMERKACDNNFEIAKNSKKKTEYLCSMFLQHSGHRKRIIKAGNDISTALEVTD